jgi:hypothetical protein
MELTIFLSLALATLASGAAVERRQGNGAPGLEDLVPMLKGEKMGPAKTIDVPPRVKPTAKRQQVRFGPFTLPPQKVCTTPRI